MKTNPIFILAIVLSGCSSQSNNPVPPPASTADYSQWSNQELEMKAASLKRTLNRSYDSGNESMGSALFTKMALDDKQQELQGVEAELLKRDPSGQLLDQVSKL